MHLTHIRIQTFRNIYHCSVNLAPGFNWWVGPNGAGKTSILEAIYLLSTSRSFRTTQMPRIISQEHTSLSVYAEVQEKTGRDYTVGIERYADGAYQAQLGGERLKKIAPLAKALPIILMQPDSLLLMTGDASYRRQFMDWGVFHVEPSFQLHWSGYQRTLKQRNILLKSPSMHNTDMLSAWDVEFVRHAEALTQARRRYLQNLLPFLLPLVKDCLHFSEISLLYDQGWPENLSIEEALFQSRAQERARGFTVIGPHRADLGIYLQGAKAREIFSRGQQKLFTYLLLLAQAALFQSQLQKSPIFLVDDIASELDNENRERILELLAKSGCQSLLTAIALSPGAVGTVFHVEHHRQEAIKVL